MPLSGSVCTPGLGPTRHRQSQLRESSRPGLVPLGACQRLVCALVASENNSTTITCSLGLKKMDPGRCQDGRGFCRFGIEGTMENDRRLLDFRKIPGPEGVPPFILYLRRGYPKNLFILLQKTSKNFFSP